MSTKITDGQQATCQRCRASPAVQDGRTQKLCNDCFGLYVRTRPIKRLEALRGNIKLAPLRPRAAAEPSSTEPTLSTAPTYLLALSGGASSLALLHALDSHVASMVAKTGRASYALHGVHLSPGAQPDLAALRGAFPDIPLDVLPLSFALQAWPAPPQLTSQIPSYASLDPEQRLSALLDLAASPTARADLLSTLLDAGLASFAREHGFTTVLRGDSTTALSASALAAVAKGRAASVAGLAESVIPGSEYTPRTAYPMRDLLRRDVAAYVVSTVHHSAPLADLLLEEAGQGGEKKPRSLKQTSIDALVRQYMADTERGTPSIVHNVLRTVGKFEMPTTSIEGRGGGGYCVCCGDQVHGNRGGQEGASMCARCEREFGAA